MARLRKSKYYIVWPGVVAVLLRQETTVEDLESSFDKPASDKVDLGDKADQMTAKDWERLGWSHLFCHDAKPGIPSLSEVVSRALKSAELILTAQCRRLYQLAKEQQEGHIKHQVWKSVLPEVHQLNDLQVAGLFSRYGETLKPVWDASIDELHLPCTLPKLGPSFRLVLAVDLGAEPGISKHDTAATVSFDLAECTGQFEISVKKLRDVLENYVWVAVEGLLFVKPNQG